MPKATYAELANLADSNSFIGRVTLAVVTYARFILNEPANTAFHRSRSTWAQNAIQNPRGVVSGLLPAIAADSIFADQDPFDPDVIPDTGAGSVQVAVESTINSTLLSF